MGRVLNAPRFTARLDDLSADARRRISQAVYDGATVIANEAKRSIRAGAVSGPGHIPSKPGEPPNADTHHLDRSIGVEQAGELKVTIFANAEYASELEYGTSRMAARPFIQPAINKTRAEVLQLFFGAIQGARGIR
jgi:HK97 gp10 family phage protein